MGRHCTTGRARTLLRVCLCGCGPGRGAGGRWWRRTTGVEDTGRNCRGAGGRRQGLAGQQIGTDPRPTGGHREAGQRCWAWRGAAGTRGGPSRGAGGRWWRRTAGVEDTGRNCRGAGGQRQGLAGLRDRPLRAKLACGDLAGGPPPTGTHSGQVQQDRPRGGRRSVGATSNIRKRRAAAPGTNMQVPTRRHKHSATNT